MKIIPKVVEEIPSFVINDRRFFIADVPHETLGKKVVFVIKWDEMAGSFDTLDKYG